MTATTLTYRPYQTGDENRINDLYRQVFDKNRSLEQWSWEFGRLPEGLAQMRVLEDGERIVAHAGLIPFRFQYFDREVVAGKFENSMIHSDYRGKKLFGRLEKECLDQARAAGYGFSWGISRSAFQAHLSAGYRQICSLRGYFGVLNAAAAAADLLRVKKINPLLRPFVRPTLGWLARRMHKRITRTVGADAGLTISEIERFDERFDALWNEFAARERVISLKRTASYLNWRFTENPHRRYRILTAEAGGRLVGYLVAAVIGRPDLGISLKIGVTADVLVLPGHEAAYSALLRSGMRGWLSDGADVIITWVHERGRHAPPLLDALKQYGYLSMRRQFEIPVLARPLGTTVDEAALCDESNWHLTLAFAGKWA